MPADTAGLTGNNIVVIGTFDPAVAQPSALLKEQIIRESDIPDMVIELLIPEAISFRLSWMSAVFEINRLIVTTTLTSPVAEPVRDFVVDVIDLMKNAQIRALGINTNYHFGTAGPDSLNQLGHLLAPKQNLWDAVLKRPLLSSMSIRGQRDDDFQGSLNVKVEPSTRIEYGVYVEVNNHFEVTEPEMLKDPTGLVNRLLDQWEPSIQKAEQIIAMLKKI